MSGILSKTCPFLIQNLSYIYNQPTKEHKMRLDHFVQLPKQHNNKGNKMSKLETPSITKSRGFQSSHNTWVQTMRFSGLSKHTRIWGRIRDTGANFIVEGWTCNNGSDCTEWVQIPCANLATAQIHLVSVMDKSSFCAEQFRQQLDRAQSPSEIQRLMDEHYGQ